MPKYFVYRINTQYDGFLPSAIPTRTSHQMMRYNWKTYVENVEVGDVVLTYFSGGGCRNGMYLVSVVRDVDPSQFERNVTARILDFRSDNRSPLLAVRDNTEFFESLRSRRRGAEVVVPHRLETNVLAKLQELPDLVQEAQIRNVDLPGGAHSSISSISDVPRIKLDRDLSSRLDPRDIACAYWIRPSQASWINHAPPWLSFISGVFSTFKSGDLTEIDELAESLASQIGECWSIDRFGCVASVPLNARKKSLGEVDRAGELARLVASKLRLTYTACFELAGEISRRVYKLRGYGKDRFVRDYSAALRLIRRGTVEKAVKRGQSILLIDDVYTDGTTTETVSAYLESQLSLHRNQICVACLGLMAKQANMDSDLITSWKR